MFICHATCAHVLNYVVFVHYMCIKECGYVFLSKEAYMYGVSRHRVVTLDIQKLNITTKTHNFLWCRSHRSTVVIGLLLTVYFHTILKVIHSFFT